MFKLYIISIQTLLKLKHLQFYRDCTYFWPQHCSYKHVGEVTVLRPSEHTGQITRMVQQWCSYTEALCQLPPASFSVCPFVIKKIKPCWTDFRCLPMFCPVNVIVHLVYHPSQYSPIKNQLSQAPHHDVLSLGIVVLYLTQIRPSCHINCLHMGCLTGETYSQCAGGIVYTITPIH